MSGVYIEGMEMPKEGEHPLWIALHSDGTVEYNANKGDGWQMTTAVPVPPHGRCIDADVLEELVIKQKYACAGASAHGPISELHKSWGLHDAELMIEAAPTIIPAEEGET